MWRFSQLAALSLLIHAVNAIPAPPANAINCAQFAADPTLQVNLDCVQFPGYPTTIAGVNVDFYHYTETDGWDLSNPNTARHVQDIRTAAENALPKYANFSTLPEIIFILAPTLPKIIEDSSPAGTTSCKVQGHTPCYIRIADDVSDLDDIASVKRTTAHELYHAVQSRNRPDFQALPPSRWWREGSATYFGDSLYPNHKQFASINTYKPSAPLYDQDLGHPAGLFFFFLWNRGFSWAQIHEFTLRQIATTDFTDTKKSMANDANIRDSFPLFAQAYKDKRIFLSDLSYASPPADNTFQITVHDYPPVRLGRDGDHVDTPIYADPFTMQSGLITLEAGQTYVFGVKPLKKNSRLYYRVLMSQTPWKPLTKAVIVQVPCSGRGSTYEFLFTSTGDRNKDGAELSVKRQSKQCCKSKRQDDESCPIESTSSGFILYPLFNPDTHGAMCPPGTHFSTIAAWCCPDGTQLDETVASEMSICCPTCKLPIFQGLPAMLTEIAADCSKDIVPNNLRCADPSWVLWTKAFRQVGCCMPGYVPNSHRYCVKDLDELGRGYSSVSNLSLQ